MRQILFLLIVSLVLLINSPAFADVVIYPQLPGSRLSATYSMTVNGQTVPVQQYNGKSYAWFAFSGSANIHITVSEAITSYQLSPKSYGISPMADDKDLFFTLGSPTKLVLRKVNSLSEELFIFADPLETNAPILGSSGVVNVLDYGADKTGNSDSQDALQNAVNAVAAQANGGVAYVPPGKYKISKTIFIKSNVHLYLAPGAVLDVPVGVGCCFGYATVLLALDSTNAKISGRGVVNGNGTQQSLFFWLVTTENADNFHLEGVMLLDGYTTALKLQDARNSDVVNVKILSDSPRLSDGIDIESSQGITIDDCFVYSSDDNSAIGAGTDPRKNVKSTENVLIKNSVFYQTRSGHTFYIGPQIAPPYIRNIVYENNDVISVEGFTGIYPFGGVNIESVTFRNIRVEEVRLSPITLWAGDCSSWGPGNCGTPAGVLGYIHNVHFDNLRLDAYGSANSIFQGYSATANVSDIYFNDFSIAGKVITDTSTARINVFAYVSNIFFSNTPPLSPPRNLQIQ